MGGSGAASKSTKKEANLSISDFERKIAKAWNGK